MLRVTPQAQQPRGWLLHNKQVTPESLSPKSCTWCPQSQPLHPSSCFKHHSGGGDLRSPHWVPVPGVTPGLVTPVVAAGGDGDRAPRPSEPSCSTWWVHETGLAGLGCSEKGRGALILFDSLVMVLIPSRRGPGGGSSPGPGVNWANPASSSSCCFLGILAVDI